eukprot:3408977-Rhodomonas_salina.1
MDGKEYVTCKEIMCQAPQVSREGGGPGRRHSRRRACTQNQTNVTLNINGEDCQAEVSTGIEGGGVADGGGGRYGTWTGRST